MPDEEPKKAVCPCCGQPTLKKPVKVDGKIIDEYLASIMTGVPFNHTFKLFDGKLRITTTMANRDEGLVLWKFLQLVEPFSSSSSRVADLLGLVNTYCSIKKIEVIGKDKKSSKIYYPSKAVTEACTKFLDEWQLADLSDDSSKQKFLDAVLGMYNDLKPTDVVSSTPPVVLTRVINDFRALETIMLEAGFDENFWKGIELG